MYVTAWGTNILLGEGHFSSVGDRSTQVELADGVRAASEDSTSNVDLEVVEVHVLLLTVLEVVALPANDLVGDVSPAVCVCEEVSVVSHLEQLYLLILDCLKICDSPVWLWEHFRNYT